MKQSVPKATVAGGRHAWSRTLILYAILPNFYKSSLRFKSEESFGIPHHKADCGRFRVMDGSISATIQKF